MVGSGAIVVCAEGRCMLDMALNATRFYRNESCGKCVPCRMGSQKLVDLLTRWTQGNSASTDMQLIQELFKAMRLTSICGLGQIVHAPLESVIKHFPAVIDQHLEGQALPGRRMLRGSGDDHQMKEQDFSLTFIPQQEIQLTIDGKSVVIGQERGTTTTIFEAAQKCGITIPTLCHQQNEKPVGVCRMCVVDIGQRVYAASCVRAVEPGMQVKTATEDVKRVRRTLLELLMADHPSPCARQKLSNDCELERLASRRG